MSNDMRMRLDDAANLATRTMAEANQLSQPEQVSANCLRDMITAGALIGGRGWASSRDIEETFSVTRVLTHTPLPTLRVSIHPLTAVPSGHYTDPIPNVGVRRWYGWDFQNELGLSDAERLAGVEGVWPIKEKRAREAVLAGTIFLPSMKGFVGRGLIREVVGYSLDLAGNSGRRWIHTAKISSDRKFRLLNDGLDLAPDAEWMRNAWVSVGQGTICQLEI